MAELVGADVVIPPSAWVPAGESDSEGTIRRYLTPTKKYPAGRLEVSLKTERGVYVWEADKLPRDWVVSSPEPSSKRSSKGKTPRKSAQMQSKPERKEEDEQSANKHGEQQEPEQHAAARKLSFAHNMQNGIILIAVSLPAIYFAWYLKGQCTASQYHLPMSKSWGGVQNLFESNFWCSLGYQHPIWAANLVFLLNCDVLFWIISNIQKSTWLIDPYWTIIPVMIGLFFQYHPAAQVNPLRSAVSMALLWVWSIRLTHNYFRREEWQLGAREDWRLASMARKMPRNWWWLSFFANNISQHLMLMGISLPLYTVHASAAPWHPVWDTLATVGCVVGLGCAWAADNQLRHYMQENERRQASGEPKMLLLDSGIWHYSRHPNYFGEQLWWWSLALYAVHLGQPWMIAGTLFNSLVLASVTVMTEKRMLDKPERADLFREYQRTTSVLVPWFKGTGKKGDSKQE